MKWRDKPSAVRPMLATLADPPLTGRGLCLRAEVRRHPRARARAAGERRDGVRIWSRLGNEKTAQFPSIVARARGAARESCEARCCSTARSSRSTSRAGRPDSSGCRDASISPDARDVEQVDKAQPVALIAFDLLRDGDEDLRGLPLTERRARLEQRFAAASRDRRSAISEQVADDGRALHARAHARRLGRADRQGRARRRISQDDAARRGGS